MNNTKRVFIYVIFLTPAFAFANAGSPMMWFGIVHLLLLNAFIGMTESLIIARFKIPNRTWLIIVANYLSMLVGMYFIAPYFSGLSGNMDFWGGKTVLGEYDMNGFFSGMLASFAVTLLIEYLFFYLSVKDKSKRKELLLPYFIANLATNVLMFIMYCINIIEW